MNFHSDNWICSKLTQHYNYAKCNIKDREVLGIFLHGSQNYGLDFETSDIDTICIVMPNKNDILTASEPYSKELTITDTNEKIVVWEIRKFINLLEKGGFKQLEILHTDYSVIGLEYFDFWLSIKAKESDILYINSYRTANSFIGMIYRCVKDISKDDYLKSYMRVLFFSQCLHGYLNHEEFGNVLQPTNADELKKIRNSNISRDDALKLANEKLNECKCLMRDYEFINNDNSNINIIRNELASLIKQIFI